MHIIVYIRQLQSRQIDLSGLYMDTEPCSWAGHHSLLSVEFLIVLMLLGLDTPGSLVSSFLLIFSPED